MLRCSGGRLKFRHVCIYCTCAGGVSWDQIRGMVGLVAGEIIKKSMKLIFT